ncbi:MAG: L-fuculose kinase [Betaproteobacteria bacterium]|nr:L-fuculose kinase [Betaproteobacteria bacterium]
MTDAGLDLTLVIDIGKSNARMFLLDEAGTVVERHNRPNASVTSALDYPALDVHGLQNWMQSSLRESRQARRCARAICVTHGAAFVALGDGGLAWEPLDYEFADVSVRSANDADFQAARIDFRNTLSPELPVGLNAARQLHWMQSAHPTHWSRTHTLLPYPQYWAWLLSGVACSEVSSLGCHTHLWNPAAADFSTLALQKGWAKLFAPMRRAWEVLGTLGPERGKKWGLPAACQVHVGAHDSNACLVRYLDARAHTEARQEALTVVSSGTWTVLMAPGAPVDTLVAEKDMLGNVDITGRVTATARFMGGREFAAIAQGAAPHTANLDELRKLVDKRIFALPSFAQQGGPFVNRTGALQQGGRHLSAQEHGQLDEATRATLASVYCAQLCAWLVLYLWAGAHALRAHIVVEGPLAQNPLFMQVLQALVPGSDCAASADTLEGTARGAWLLTRWGQPDPTHTVQAQPGIIENLDSYHAAWLAEVGLTQYGMPQA